MDLVYYSAFLPALSPPFHNITVTFGDKNCVTILPSDPLDVLFAKGRGRGGLGAKNTPCITETQQTLINPRNLICLCINFYFEIDHSVSFRKEKVDRALSVHQTTHILVSAFLFSFGANSLQEQPEKNTKSQSNHVNLCTMQ